MEPDIIINKQDLMDGFNNPEYTSVVVEVKIPGCPEPEHIINHKPNFEAKKAYYDNAYDDNLIMINNPDIRIVNFRFYSFEKKEE